MLSVSERGVNPNDSLNFPRIDVCPSEQRPRKDFLVVDRLRSVVFTDIVTNRV